MNHRAERHGARRHAVASPACFNQVAFANNRVALSIQFDPYATGVVDEDLFTDFETKRDHVAVGSGVPRTHCDDFRGGGVFLALALPAGDGLGAGRVRKLNQDMIARGLEFAMGHELAVVEVRGTARRADVSASNTSFDARFNLGEGCARSANTRIKSSNG